MIRNHTPYIGEIYLKFEKIHHNTPKSTLNSIHLDLGFIKLVSRIKPKRYKDKLEIDPKKVELIELMTGGIIGHFMLNEQEYTLPNSFMTHDGKYLGDIRDGWFYVKNRLIICPTNYRVAIKVRKDFFDTKSKRVVNKNYSDEFIEGFYGYSHRGGCIFKKGDRLFDPTYYPKMEDYSQKEWKKYTKKLKNVIKKQIKDGFLTSDKSIREIMPFNRRGKVVIETWEQAEQAALNLLKYLS